MAVTAIPVDTSKRLGARLRNMIDAGRRWRDELAALRDVIEAHVDLGPPAVYDAIETYFGTPAGTGQTVYNLVVGAEAQAHQGDITAMLDRLG